MASNNKYLTGVLESNHYARHRHKKNRNSIWRNLMIIIIVLFSAVIFMDKFMGFGFNIVDYILLGVLCVTCLTGYFKGVILSVFSIAGYILGLVSAKLFSPFVASFMIEKTNITVKINTVITNQFKTMNIPAFNVENQVNGSVSGIDISAVNAADLKNIGELTSKVPETKQVFDVNPLFEQMFKQFGDFAGNMTEKVQNATTTMVDSAVYIVVLLIASICLFIVTKIIVTLIGRIVNALSKSSSVLSFFNKLGGLAIGVLAGVVLIFVLVNYGFPLISAFAAKSPLINELHQSVIASFFI